MCVCVCVDYGFISIAFCLFIATSYKVWVRINKDDNSTHT